MAILLHDSRFGLFLHMKIQERGVKIKQSIIYKVFGLLLISIKLICRNTLLTMLYA